MSIVCIDTQILYWAIVKKAPPNSEHLIATAGEFMQWVEEKKFTVIVPTIVLGEMLVPIPKENHAQVLKQFRQDWMIVDYDVRAASIFADMRHDHIIQNRFRELRTMHPDTTKKELVADVMIIATAIAHRANTIYSHNRDLRAMAAGFIEAQSMDEIPLQMGLNFEDLPAVNMEDDDED